MKIRFSQLCAAVCTLLFALLPVVLGGCASHAGSGISDARGSAGGADGRPTAAKHSAEVSGVFPLVNGADAFVARMALAEKAQRSLDLQYYIWHGDQTGKLLAGAVIQAAERGVKSRLLLDDMGVAAKDRNLLILDSHPNIEVRLFNPLPLRSARMLGVLLDFQRVNRRMHNKSFIVDGKVAIVGGRNIGDEYFGVAEGMNFADFDVVARGPVVGEVEDSFELYWNSEASVPITKVSRVKVSDAEIQKEVKDLVSQRESMARSPYGQIMRSSRLAKATLNGLPFYEGRAVVVADHPNKVLTRPDDASTHLAPQLRAMVERAKGEVLLVSPYFIPGKNGVDWFAELRKRGVKVTVITNSLASTDVAAVHAGYIRYRKSLLRGGVEVCEMKAVPPAPGEKSGYGGSSFSLTGSSKAGLHAKTFVFDRRWVFVGSMNLDPRSLNLNTEVGMLVDSPELAQQMLGDLERKFSERAYHVELTPDGLQWTTKEDGKIVVLKSEPKGGFKKGLMLRICSMLPIESQL
ncbi:phospholipase D family protein [Verrucomicrobium sp. BvORR034]|uniref:phospholipase D-like domain-containing protein n=1 Tax=Verrucomicrobium sp. BvORR034 TaxID=1396418 RepID=UPI000679AF2F|nr:phospholipase D family protein [Verrucomicrobium sp. BvORR034]